MEILNIAELLQDAPKGVRLWSKIHGDVIFVEICGDIICRTDHPFDNSKIQFDEEGHWLYGEWNSRSLFSESVVLFPSKGCLTWENFKASWLPKHFEPFQKILFKCNKHDIWNAGFYARYQREEDKPYGHDPGRHIIIGHETLRLDNSLIIPFEGNESLLGTKKALSK